MPYCRLEDAEPVVKETPPPPPIKDNTACGTSTLSCGEPFIFFKRTKQIKICRGCNQKFKFPITTPNDFVLQHRESYTFINKTKELQRTIGNRYYHVCVQCIKAKFDRVPLNKNMFCIPPGTNFSAEHVSMFMKSNVDVRAIGDKCLF